MSRALEAGGAATAPLAEAVDPAVHGSAGPWRTALGQLGRNKGAMISLAVLLLVVVACLLAPLYASKVAHVDPFASNVSGTTVVDGKEEPLLAPSSTGLGLGVTPIGPTWNDVSAQRGAEKRMVGLLLNPSGSVGMPRAFIVTEPLPSSSWNACTA